MSTDGENLKQFIGLLYDPPSGWQYGFPKKYQPKDDETLEDTLRRDGYSERLLADGMAQYCRFIGIDESAPAESKAEGGTMDMRDKCKRIEKFQQGTCCEPPQPSVQLCNDTTCGLPKCHAIHGTARGQHTFVEPSVQGEQDTRELAEKVLTIRYNENEHWRIEYHLERGAIISINDRTDVKLIRAQIRGMLVDFVGRKSAPAITSDRIEEIAKEQFDCVKRVACVADIETAMRKALRVAGVRVG